MLRRIGLSCTVARRVRVGERGRWMSTASAGAPSTAAPVKDLRWYNSNLNKCLKMRYFPQAIQLYQEMKSANVEPNPVTYELIFSVYSELKDSESAAELMAELKAKGVKTVLQQLEDQVKAMSSNREDRDKAMRLFSRFERLKQAGVNVFSSP
eukprot:TRINITY_DN8166_c0_g1_i1.p1 TRINITY_DN8166_c0_g1~~TRINITY_DN8166_c0_g1_i1.p1  ORF type:complete len:153 (-),score=31.56 TRINITY_DN8166_c0_g1_i1:629-1087(-)